MHLYSPDFRFCPRCGGPLVKRRPKAIEPERLVCDTCAFILFLDPKVATGTLISMDGGVLLLKRGIEPAYGRWVFPGGYVDRGEPVEEAAIRETKEEVNLDVRLDGLLSVYSYPENPVVVIAYRASIVGGELKVGDETLEVRAFKPPEIPWDLLAFQSTKDAVRDFLRSGLAIR